MVCRSIAERSSTCSVTASMSRFVLTFSPFSGSFPSPSSVVPVGRTSLSGCVSSLITTRLILGRGFCESANGAGRHKSKDKGTGTGATPCSGGRQVRDRQKNSTQSKGSQPCREAAPAGSGLCCSAGWYRLYEQRAWSPKAIPQNSKASVCTGAGRIHRPDKHFTLRAVGYTVHLSWPRLVFLDDAVPKMQGNTRRLL